jgi:tetratricopeptide (TPR) repeat protein
MTVDWRKWLPWIVVAGGLLAYANSGSGPFIFDDSHGILNNPSIRHLWPLTQSLVAPPDSGMAGRPVVNLTFAINYALGGLDVRGYHAVNLAIHLLAGLVLLGIVRRTAERCQPATDNTWLAGAVALLWVLHPLQTETVDFISERTEGLMGLFLLLTLYAAIRSFDSPRPARWQWTAVAACGLGMGCKEVMVAAPLLVWLYDYMFVTGSPSRSLRQRPQLYVGLALTWLMLPILMAGVTVHAKMGEGLDYFTPWEYAKMQCTILVHYLRLVFWPHPLVIDYDDWPRVASLWSIIPQGALIIGLLILSAWGTYRRRWWGFLGAWFFLILAPTSSFLPLATEVAAERRMYLPLAAVLVPVVVALGRSRKLVVPVLAIGLGILTWQRNTDYRTAESIWRDTVAKRPNNGRALVNLAALLFESGDSAEAVQFYDRALVLNPKNAEAQYNLGIVLAAQNQPADALPHFQQAAALAPTSSAAQYVLGVNLAHLGRLPEAEAALREALRLEPGSYKAILQLGLVLANEHRLREALPYFQEAAHQRPDDEEARRVLAAAVHDLAQTNAVSRQP